MNKLRIKNLLSTYSIFIFTLALILYSNTLTVQAHYYHRRVYNILDIIFPLLLLVSPICYTLKLKKQKRKQIEIDSELYFADDLSGSDNEIKKKLIKFKKYDINFNEERFLLDADNMLRIFQEAWSNNDYKKLRQFESDELYLVHEKELKQCENNGITQITEITYIENCKIYSIYKTKDRDFIKVIFYTKSKDYDLRKSDNKIIDGNDVKEYDLTYTLTFSRLCNVSTKENYDRIWQRCPNCNCDESINSNGICNICQNHVGYGEFNWILEEILKS